MPGDRFFDTNILIYAFAAADHRSARAEALMAEGGGDRCAGAQRIH